MGDGGGPGPEHDLDELTHWWQKVATDVFDDTKELEFHLTKGTADRYKSDIDEIAEPERYFFRGPVSWTIRTYSKFMHLPATYSSRGSHFTRDAGSMTDGTV